MDNDYVFFGGPDDGKIQTLRQPKEEIVFIFPQGSYHYSEAASHLLQKDTLLWSELNKDGVIFKDTAL